VGSACAIAPDLSAKRTHRSALQRFCFVNQKRVTKVSGFLFDLLCTDIARAHAQACVP
jgi:hypothetical protein